MSCVDTRFAEYSGNGGCRVDRKGPALRRFHSICQRRQRAQMVSWHTEVGGQFNQRSRAAIRIAKSMMPKARCCTLRAEPHDDVLRSFLLS